MNVDPRMAKSMKEWVEYSTFALSQLVGVVPVLAADIEWVDWAYDLIQNPQIQKYSPPDPRYFNSWQEWVFRFNQAVPL